VKRRPVYCEVCARPIGGTVVLVRFRLSAEDEEQSERIPMHERCAMDVMYRARRDGWVVQWM
jgi:hypothetical protein